MGKVVDGREYNWAVVYEEDGERKVVSYATTRSEADTKLELATSFLEEPIRSTLRIEDLSEAS